MATTYHENNPEELFQGLNLGDLERSLLRPRNLISFVLTGAVTVITLLAMVPLFSVVYSLLVRGGRLLSVTLFTQVTPVAFEGEGGIGNAVVGTLIIVGIASLISVPVGVLAAIFLAEVGPESKTASAVRFCAKTMTGFPSILAGVFVYSTFVVLTGGASAWAGGIALSLLMIPTVLLTAEDAIRMVPARMREAAIGMGTTPTQTIWHVLLPTAFPGILTGVMLAIARAAGETAPLLFTANFSNEWVNSTGSVELDRPIASLSVFIYNSYNTPDDFIIELGWAASLVLVFLVLITNLIGQFLAPKRF